MPLQKYVGVDIYHYSNVTNWQDVKSSLDFVMLKIGQGSGIDSEFLNRARECSDLDIPYGGYWFANSSNLAGTIDEANRCVATLQTLVQPTYKAPTFPIAYDFERNTLDPSSASDRALACQMCRAFLNRVANAGFIPMLYTNPSFYLTLYQDIVNNELVNQQYELWLARYIDSNHPTGLLYPTLPNRETPDGYFNGYGYVHFENLGIWQWGYWRGIPGFNGKQDGDISYKDYGNIIPPRPPFPTYSRRMPLWMMLKQNY